MVLHRDALIELTYNAASETLLVKWHTCNSATSAELESSYNLLLGAIGRSGAQNLLLDASKDALNLTDEDFVEINVRLGEALVKSRLKKIARLCSPNTNRENFVETLAEDLLAAPSTAVVYQNFRSERAALKWLAVKG